MVDVEVLQCLCTCIMYNFDSINTLIQRRRGHPGSRILIRLNELLLPKCHAVSRFLLSEHYCNFVTSSYCSSGSITIGSSYHRNGSPITSKICWYYTGVSIPLMCHWCSVMVSTIHREGAHHRRCCWSTPRTYPTFIVYCNHIATAILCKTFVVHTLWYTPWMG